jgi:WD40 repeat protein
MQLLKVLFGLLLLTYLSFAQASSLEQNALRFKARIGFIEKDDRIAARKFLDDGRKILLVGKKTIQIWDVTTAHLLEERPHEIPGLDKIEALVLISPDARKAIVLDAFSWRLLRKEKKVSAGVYDLQTGKLITVLERPIESIRFAQWSENGGTLVTYNGLFNDKRTEICFWDGEDLSFRAAVSLKGFFRTPYLSRDGKRLIVSTQLSETGIFNTNYNGETETTVRNTENGKVEQTFTDGNGKSFYVWWLHERISPNEKLFVSSLEKNITVWEIGGDALSKYEIKAAKKNGYIYFEGFSDDGKYLIAHQNKTVEFYNASSGQLEFSMPVARSFSDAKLLEDGKTLLLQSCERAEGYDLPTQQKLYEIRLVCKSESDLVSSYDRDFDVLSFHPNGKLLLTFSDKTVRVWNARTGVLAQTIVDPNRLENKRKDNNKDDGLGWHAGWLIGGKYLFASGADEKSILLWETKE